MSLKLGNQLRATKTESTIAYHKLQCIRKYGPRSEFENNETEEESIKRLRLLYESSPDDNTTITRGYDLILMLCPGHPMKGVSVCRKVLPLSQRILGHNHSTTQGIEFRMHATLCAAYFVELKNHNGIFRALSYEGDQCVLEGPFTPSEVAAALNQSGKASGQDRKQTVVVDAKNVILPKSGTPVICHGLVNNATYLNGKIGEVRCYDETAGRYGAYLDDKSIKPKNFKPKNLRIYFDL